MSHQQDTRSGRPPVIPVTAGAYKALKRDEAPATERRPERRPAPQQPRPARTSDRSLAKTKKILVAWLAFGAVLYFGASGTFASFSAETSNTGSTLASGTLTMSNQVNSATACLSSQAASANNLNANCNKLFQLTNLAPGVYGGTATVTIQNTGSLDGAKLSFGAAAVSARLSSGIAPGSPATPITALPVTPLEGNIASGDSLLVTYGTDTQTFVASAAVAGGATSIPVNSLVPLTFPAGAVVTDTDGNSLARGTTNCFDIKTTTGATSGATAGTDLNFNPIAGNPLCSKTLLYVQETTGGKNYCWYGKTYTSGAPGMCAAPISVTLSAPLSTTGPTTSLPVTALNGNVKSGEYVTVTSGTNTQTFQAAANAYANATSITINSATPTFAFPTGSTVTHSPLTTQATALTTLNPDQINTIANFDTGHAYGSGGSITLYPLTSNGNYDNTASVQLAHNASRTFLVGVYVPAPAGSVQNFLQGLQSSFGITWHIDQS